MLFGFICLFVGVFKSNVHHVTVLTLGPTDDVHADTGGTARVDPATASGASGVHKRCVACRAAAEGSLVHVSNRCLSNYCC